MKDGADNVNTSQIGKTWLAAHLVSDDVAFGRLNSMADHNSNLVISH